MKKKGWWWICWKGRPRVKCHPKSFWLLKGHPKRHSLLSMGYLWINLKQWKIVSVCSLNSLPCLPTLLSQPCLSRRLYCICFKLFRFPLADYVTTTARSAPLCSYPGLGIHMGITGLSNLLSIMCKCENVIFWWVVFYFHMSAFNYFSYVGPLLRRGSRNLTDVAASSRV